MIKKHGGKVQAEVEGATHCIATANNTEKVKNCQSLKIFVLKESWVWDCLRHLQLLETKSYAWMVLQTKDRELQEIEDFDHGLAEIDGLTDSDEEREADGWLENLETEMGDRKRLKE